MGRFTAQDVDRYGGQGGAGYFSLKNDKDVARVRFMYNSIEDVDGYAVHAVEIDGRKRWVNCLREYKQPIDDCPFCKARYPQFAKLFVPIYNEDDGKVQVWERGKKFFGKMSSVCARYPDVCSHIFEIERNGRAGDQTTTYEIYEVEKDDTVLDDLPEAPQIMGSVVLDKTAEEMQYYIDNGYFASEDEAPVRRRSSSREEAPARRERRTPVTSEDRF